MIKISLKAFVFFVCLVVLVNCDNNSDNKTVECQLKGSSPYEKRTLERLSVLKGEKYTWEDPDAHTYYFGICTAAENSNANDEGLVQINRLNKNRFVIGRLDDVDLEGTGKNRFGNCFTSCLKNIFFNYILESVIRMVYKNGDNYANACNKAQRNAVIYFECDPSNVTKYFNSFGENVFLIFNDNEKFRQRSEWLKKTLNEMKFVPMFLN